MERGSSTPAEGRPPARIEPRPSSQFPVQVAIWALHLALPLLGLWLLVERPRADVAWEHHPSHFWLVAGVAVVNAFLGYRMSLTARRRSDARLFLVGLAFFVSASFLFLHALATPAVLLEDKNAGFEVATPVGLFLAAVLAVASSVDFSPERSAAFIRRERVLRWGLVALVVAWAAVSLARLPPLDIPPAASEAHGPLVGLAAVSVVLYAIASLRYFKIHRARPAAMLIGLITAFALLSEAMIAVAFARNWHLSWWLWHLLMAAGFGFVAYSAYVQYQREGSAAGIFNGVGVSATVRRIRAEYGSALETLVSALMRQEEEGWTEQEMKLITAGLGARFELTEGQTQVLSRAAEALATDREHVSRLTAIARVGQEAKVLLREPQILEHAIELMGPVLGRDGLRIGLSRDGEVIFPPALATGVAPGVPQTPLPADALASAQTLRGSGLLLIPLVVKDRPAGVMEVSRPHGDFADRDVSLFETLANQLSIALENARLYANVEGLFRQYMSPEVASALIADPGRAELGGAIREVTALFADLGGFTSFSERSSPEDVVRTLNAYFEVVVPRLLDQGGTIVQFVGDAILALFNAPVAQPDHAARATRSAVAFQRAAEDVRRDESWPQYRIGINTGPAIVGNVGTQRFRNFNAMGDTVNVAARLQTWGRPGQIVIGESTYQAIRGGAEVEPLGPLDLKGKAAPVRAYLLKSLKEPQG